MDRDILAYSQQLRYKIKGKVIDLSNDYLGCHMQHEEAKLRLMDEIQMDVS
jgi:hypothetical protein